MPVAGSGELRQEVEEIMGDILPIEPPGISPLLCHYTSMSVTLLILQYNREDVFLSECRYCNDRGEFSYAFSEATQILAHWPNQPFATAVDNFLLQLKQEAYVFCLCEPPADRLSQWRGYGADGRGTCISFDPSGLLRITQPGRERRLTRVKYNRTQMQTDLTQIIQNGENRHQAASWSPPQQTIVVQATALALYYVCPIYKDRGFEEEKEWRFLYMPVMTTAAPAPVYYRDRSGFVIPYVRLSEVATLPGGAGQGLPTRNAGPGLPITEIMVGPSGLIELNLEALTDFVSAHPNQANRINVDKSVIPYRP